MLALASTSFFAYDAAYITRTLNICTGFTAILFSLVKLGWRMELNAARCVAGKSVTFLGTHTASTPVKLKCANQP